MDEDLRGSGTLGCRAGEFSRAAGGNGSWDGGRTGEIATIKCFPDAYVLEETCSKTATS